MSYIISQLVLAALLGVSLAMPQQRATGVPAPVGNPNVRILSFESYQDGANFGHQLFQEDGTTSGQKYGPDGLLYGFYSYLQQDGTRVKVYWRAGAGVGYEVLGVEGLVAENLGNLKATIPQTPSVPTPAPARPPRVLEPNTFIPNAPTPAPHTPVRVDAPKPAARLLPETTIPVVPTPAPHRFDYPATLNLERTATGFFSSLIAT